VKTQFQNVPFKFKLRHYSEAGRFLPPHYSPVNFHNPDRWGPRCTLTPPDP
jgi:hypothetical protein